MFCLIYFLLNRTHFYTKHAYLVCVYKFDFKKMKLKDVFIFTEEHKCIGSAKNKIKR